MNSPPAPSSTSSASYLQQGSSQWNNARKRLSGHGHSTQHQGAPKRRKAGSVTGSTTSSAHPLRQTSFPPEEGDFPTEARSGARGSERSFSVDSEQTRVTGTSTGGVGKQKAKAKRKSKEHLPSKATSESATSRGRGHGRRIGGGSTRTDDGDHGEEGDEEDDDEDDDDDDGGDTARGLGADDDTNQMDKEAEKKNLSILVDAFDADQAERYAAFRRVKLRKDTVRKIVNFTLAQSVPAPIVTTINGYTKTFIGHLIERARDVQEQWAQLEPPESKAREASATDDIRSREIAVEDEKVENKEIEDDIAKNAKLVAQRGDDLATLSPIKPKEEPRDDAANLDAIQPEEQGKTKPDKPEQPDKPDKPEKLEKSDLVDQNGQPMLGPILPDHLREALRRYRQESETQATGLTGVSVGLGLPGIKAARLHGRPLFQ